MRTIAISDIHGHNNTFRALLEHTGLTKDDELIILGDCIDRGPNSKGVLDTIIGLQQDGYNVKCIMGNHEDMMLRAHYESSQSFLWFYNGSETTLKSFKVKSGKDIPPEYIAFIETFNYEYESGNNIFVHAGLNMRIYDPFQDEQSKLWITDWYDQINNNWLSSRKIIHGHVINTQSQIVKNLDNFGEFPFMCIDNGCYYNNAGFHQLCAFDLTNNRLYFNRNIG